jgi:hypothetical protein
VTGDNLSDGLAGFLSSRIQIGKIYAFLVPDEPILVTNVKVKPWHSRLHLDRAKLRNCKRDFPCALT